MEFLNNHLYISFWFISLVLFIGMLIFEDKMMNRPIHFDKIRIVLLIILPLFSIIFFVAQIATIIFLFIVFLTVEILDI